MKNWPLPNLNYQKITLPLEWDRRNWRYSEYEKNYKNPLPEYYDFPRGWGNPWPDMPSPDEEMSDVDFSSIRLSIPRNRCASNSLLGYYIGWHILGVSFRNENGREAYDGLELKRYNDTLPEENRFGIHICTQSINSYIEKFSTDGLDPADVPDYLEYCTYLTLVYVIAHEWGHYRSELLSLQLGKLSDSMSGMVNNNNRPCYLSYFANKKRFPDSNFEEVFAEWASLKLGIFNYYMKAPSFASKRSNWPLIESTVKYMLTEVISRPTRIRPYSDIRHWIDFKKITESVILRKFSQNKSSVNRSVNDNVQIEGVRSLLKGKIIDLLVHNQMQFSTNHHFNGIVESTRNSYPINPDSIFYHFGYDDSLDGQKASKTDNFLSLNLPPQTINFCFVHKVLEGLKVRNDNLVYFPIRVFPEILPLDSVYFH
jgi:hypothetical protein